MKLIFAVMSEEDAAATSAELSRMGYISTMMSGEGGFLRSAKKVLMVGVENMRLSEVLQCIEKFSHSREELVSTELDGGFYTLPERVRVGGAAVFIVDVEQFLKM